MFCNSIRVHASTSLSTGLCSYLDGIYPERSRGTQDKLHRGARYKSVVIILFCLVAADLAFALPTVPQLRSAQVPIDVAAITELSLGKYAEILEDPSANLTYAQVNSAEYKNKFVQSAKDTPSFGYTKSAYWVRFVLKNSHPAPQQHLLEIGYPGLDSVKFYGCSQVHEPIVAGRLLPFSNRYLQYRNIIFPVDIAGKFCVLTLRFESKGSMQLPLTLWTRNSFAENINVEQYAFGLYYGAMFVMILYNLFLFFSIRDRSYLYYVLYISSFALFGLVFNGFAYEFLWPNSPAWNARSVLVLQFSTMLVFCIFTRRYLDIDRQFPFSFWSLIILSVALTILIPSSFFFSFRVNVVIAALLAFITPILIIIIGISSLWRGFRPARYFVLALLALLVGVAMIALRGSGILPPIFLTSYGMQIGSAMEVVLLSLGLADRINSMKKEAETLLEESHRLKGELVQKEKMAAVGNMAAGIVHDFKNPVHIIKGAAEFAGDDDLSRAERRQYLKIISEEAERLAIMAQEILDFTTGQLHISKETISIAGFLAIIESMLQPYFTPKNINFIIQNNETGAGSLLLDIARMKRVFINIAGNAADALEQGGNFTIEANNHDLTVVFSLIDDGPGIPAVIRPTFFEAFVTSGKLHGTGLGMAISKGIVEAHGGKISYKTETDKGTTFFVELPV